MVDYSPENDALFVPETQSITTILLADDHPMLRMGVRQLLTHDPSFKVIAETGNGNDTMDQVYLLRPDILILDIIMPGLDGLTIAKRIDDSDLSTKVVILTIRDDSESLNAALDANVAGYVLKDSGTSNMLQCLRNVREGKLYFTSVMSTHLVEKRDHRLKFMEEYPGLNDVTKAEYRVLKLIADSKTTIEIAELLDLAESTIENHRGSIAKKLGLNGSYRLMKWAIENRAWL